MSGSAHDGPFDTLHLWYLGTPAQPMPVGELNLVLSGRGVSLRYGSDWLRSGFALSEDLPLIDREYLPRERDTAAGAVDDARPDRWGERVIRLLERPARLSLMEMLYFAGDERFGALGVSISADRYLSREQGPLPTLLDVEDVHRIVQRVLAGERIEERYRRLISPGATMGGAQPKALVAIDGATWVLKFAGEGGFADPLAEHAALTLAAKAGIEVAETRPVRLARGAAVAVKRFDRAGGKRLHALTANVALKAAGAELSYPALAQLLRRRGVAEKGRDRSQMRELFRRLAFNILIDNSDDHEKNHALLLTDSQHYLLSPAFDVVPTAQALGYQAMSVGTDGAVSSLENALSMCRSYGMSRQEAVDEARRVVAVVQKWKRHFRAAGLEPAALESLAERIDRPHLLEQRRSLAR